MGLIVFLMQDVYSFVVKSLGFVVNDSFKEGSLYFFQQKKNELMMFLRNEDSNLIFRSLFCVRQNVESNTLHLIFYFLEILSVYSREQFL